MRAMMVVLFGLMVACGGPLDEVEGDKAGREEIVDGPVQLESHWDYAEGYAFDEGARLRWSTHLEGQDEARAHRERTDVDLSYGRYMVISARGDQDACVFAQRFNDLAAMPDDDSGCEWTWGAYLNLIGDYPGPDYKGLGMLVRTEAGQVAKLLVLNDHMQNDVAMIEFDHAMVE